MDEYFLAYLFLLSTICYFATGIYYKKIVFPGVGFDNLRPFNGKRAVWLGTGLIFILAFILLFTIRRINFYNIYTIFSSIVVALIGIISAKIATKGYLWGKISYLFMVFLIAIIFVYLSSFFH